MSLRGRRHGGGRKNELVFLTTAGPATTFDPKITGVAGTWYFDDGTTLAAASGAEISKTFAADGLHRAVYRPASGGLAAITAIDCVSDAIVFIKNMNILSGCLSITGYTNNAWSQAVSDLPRNLTTAYIVTTKMYGPISAMPKTLTTARFAGNSYIEGSLADLPSQLQYLYLNGNTNITGSLLDLPTSSLLVYLYGDTGITPASVAHLITIRDLRLYDMGWDSAGVGTVIDSMWAARANYTYATPALQIGGTNQAPTGNVIAPIEGADWHQDGATWIPLTAGAKIYDLANNVNSEVRPSWAITYTA